MNQFRSQFRQIRIDKYVFYWVKHMYILYTDDVILERPEKEELRYIVADIKASMMDINEE